MYNFDAYWETGLCARFSRQELAHSTFKFHLSFLNVSDITKRAAGTHRGMTSVKQCLDIIPDLSQGNNF